MGEIKNLDDSNFKEEIKKAKFAVVDFWAAWCGPCKMFAGTFKEFAEKHDDITCIKVNVDEAKQTASQYNVMSIPTIMIFKDGEVVKQQAGAFPIEALENIVNQVK